MANLFDYLDWRGDLSFAQAGFNEVDGLILSWLAYVAFDGIVPETLAEDDAVTVKEAAEAFFQAHDLEQVLTGTISITRTSALLLEKLAKCRRYFDVKLCGFVNYVDYEKETQFCAMTVLLTPQRFCVVFRGTDETLIGWKEDFNMSFLPVVPAQQMALDYLEKAGAAVRGSLYVCGHSKGGNLAVYAGVRASSRVRRRIVSIYNNDGPGFYNTEELGGHYGTMLPRIKNFVPESSVVGILLEHEGGQIVVKSTEHGFNQHDATSWEVLGSGFVTLPGLSEGSRLLQRMLKNWLLGLPGEEREQFVDTLYGILELTKAKTVDDLNADKFKIASAVLKNYGNLDKQTKKMLTDTLKALVKEGNLSVRALLPER